MPFVDGFLAPVPTANRDAYRKSAEAGWTMFREYGALKMRECWGVDVPDGEVTSFPMAVKKADDEVVVFSWIEWPDKATRDACYASMETDPRWKETMKDMPFDGKRMMWGGFEVLFDA
jgi:uncharacterized protein YbaA (DUF1428 family)